MSDPVIDPIAPVIDPIAPVIDPIAPQQLLTSPTVITMLISGICLLIKHYGHVVSPAVQNTIVQEILSTITIVGPMIATAFYAVKHKQTELLKTALKKVAPCILGLMLTACAGGTQALYQTNASCIAGVQAVTVLVQNKSIPAAQGQQAYTDSTTAEAASKAWQATLGTVAGANTPIPTAYENALQAILLDLETSTPANLKMHLTISLRRLKTSSLTPGEVQAINAIVATILTDFPTWWNQITLTSPTAAQLTQQYLDWDADNAALQAADTLRK